MQKHQWCLLILLKLVLLYQLVLGLVKKNCWYSVWKSRSSQNINSPKHVKVAHQTAARLGDTDKANNVAIFDNLNVTNYHFDIDAVRYPRDGVSIGYGINVYVDQYCDLKLLYKEYVAKELPNPFVRYTDIKNKNPTQVIDLKFQVDHIFPKKFIYLKNTGLLLIMLDCLCYYLDLENFKWYQMVIKILKLILFRMTKFIFEDFMKKYNLKMVIRMNLSYR